MRQRAQMVGAGVRRRLPDVLASAERVLLVISTRVLRQSKVVPDLGDRTIGTFTEWSPNPSLEQALLASRVREAFAPDAIVAVGGGSAIDVAKMARSLPSNRTDAMAVLRGERDPLPVNQPLIALPTTAGSGSEMTRFATVYVDRIKHSLDHASVRPDTALIDPELLATCPLALRYSCAFDALCHAVESFWSTRATPESQDLALRALRAVISVLDGSIRAPGPSDYLQLAIGATTAGRAIDLTRTTAAHAFSYRLTADFGVPHGVACLLNLRWLLDYNLARGDFPELSMLFPSDGVGAGQLAGWLADGGFGVRLGDYGVRAADLADLVAAGLGSGRVAGNPRPLDPVEVTAQLRRLL
ncbi:MAG TPA: phosphonoacetaldehyde reductase [Jatrophihabitans sp.]|uniref:phosphonoacetaldehyde reductase n=1 Tax=Jatrophihabitans sp. TaxID=1932789 RepID=UPI002F1D540D